MNISGSRDDITMYLFTRVLCGEAERRDICSWK